MPGGLSRVNAGHKPLRCSFNKPYLAQLFQPTENRCSSLSLPQMRMTVMMMVVAAVMKPSCLASLHALKKVTRGDGGEEESRAARSAVSAFAVCVST